MLCLITLLSSKNVVEEATENCLLQSLIVLLHFSLQIASCFIWTVIWRGFPFCSLLDPADNISLSLPGWIRGVGVRGKCSWKAPLERSHSVKCWVWLYSCKNGGPPASLQFILLLSSQFHEKGSFLCTNPRSGLSLEHIPSFCSSWLGKYPHRGTRSCHLFSYFKGYLLQVRIFCPSPPGLYMFLIKTHCQTPGLQREHRQVSAPDVSCKLFCAVQKDRNHVAGCSCRPGEPLSWDPCRANSRLRCAWAGCSHGCAAAG